jgi:phosphatidylserine/phosphatidylglycerophosphate/cardiolipin synthase-like enzyme
MDRLTGWAMAQDIVAQEVGGPGTIALGQGYGYQGQYWKLFFTSPQKAGRPPNQFGIDMRFVDAIGRARKSIDIAVFEFNSSMIRDALLEAHRRGVRVRFVTGELGFEERGETFGKLESEGIPIVVRPSRNQLMHNKFAILDGKTVWTGSWNYTEGATYSNNENAIALEGEDIAGRYQAVFNQMFEEKLFGSARRPVVPVPTLGHGVVIMFSPEDSIAPELVKRIRGARRSIAFMAFSLTLDEVAQAVLAQSRSLTVRGILEPKLAQASKASKALCGNNSHVELRLGSSPRFLHHDVFVLDEELVITGSTNFARHGMEVNDENILFIPDRSLANKYMAEFSRLWTQGRIPDAEFCQSASQ